MHGAYEEGCSHHVTKNNSLFSNLFPKNGERVIVVVDNVTHLIVKEGTVKILTINYGENKNIKLNDVYHVLGLKKI